MAKMPVTPDGRRVYIPDGEVITAFFWDQPKFGAIQGPIGSGTSTAGCHKIWRLACEQEPDDDGVRRTRWAVCRRTYKELRETIIKTTWLLWFPEDKWGPFIRSEPMVHRLIDVKNGGPRPHPSGDGTFVDCEVIFLAVPDADVAEEICASYEITGFFFNEGQFVEKEVIDELLSRCGRYPSMSMGNGATWWGGFMDMNAPIEGHWIPYMRGDIPLPAEMSDDEKESFEKPDDWAFYIQPPGLIEEIVDGRPAYRENPKAENQKWLKEPYTEKIKGKKKDWIDRRVLNKVGLHQAGKPVYPTFSEAYHVHPIDLDPVLELQVICGLDFGRDPAAVFLQQVNGLWTAHSELIGDNESAQLFAPRVKNHLARWFPGATVEFWGDPRGGDGTQATEVTAFDVFQAHGMRVLPATTDNNPELRRSTVEGILAKRVGLKVNPTRCPILKRGLAGGYHYAKIKGRPGMYQPRPVKNGYSHVVEAMENGLLGGGEGHALVANKERPRPRPTVAKRDRISLRRPH